jgi:hypothetical protein
LIHITVGTLETANETAKGTATKRQGDFRKGQALPLSTNPAAPRGISHGAQRSRKSIEFEFTVKHFKAGTKKHV